MLLKCPRDGNHWSTYCPGHVIGYGPTAGKLWNIHHHVVPTSRSNSLMFGPLKKHLAGKNFAKDTDVKEAFSSQLEAME